MANRNSMLGGARTVMVDERLVQDGRGGSGACFTDWYTADGTYSAEDPGGALCEGELSKHLKQGRRRLRAVYASCPFTIITSDVPTNDLGPIQNFRDVVSSLKHTKGSQRVLSGAMASPLALNYSQQTAEDLLPAVGVHVKLAYSLSLTQAVQIQIAVTNVEAILGLASTVTGPLRDVTIQLDAGCIVAEIFLPFADNDEQSQVWAPRGARIQSDSATVANNSTVTLTGLVSGAGTAYAQFVSPTSPLLERIFGAMNNT